MGDHQRDDLAGFCCPDWPLSVIIDVLAAADIAVMSSDDIANPTADVVCSIYATFLSNILEDVSDDQIGFDALELLDNPDDHMKSIPILNLYRKIKDLFASIQFPNFMLRDLLKPDGKRTAQILSNMANFIYHRDARVKLIQTHFEKFPDYEERKKDLRTRVAELNKEIGDHEVAHQLEEPIVQEVDAEVRKLKQAIQNYNKQQMSLKTVAKGLKEKNGAIIEKISQADFELVKSVQENTKLSSRIVQSPDKLPRALEEKKATRTEAKNSEKFAMESVQTKTTTLEVYSKAYDKMSKHFSHMQAIQEQVNQTKAVDKDVKACKANLSDEGILNMSLDAKMDEWQGQAKRLEELIKAMEKESDTRHEQDNQRLENLRTELEWKLRCLEPRENAVEALVVMGDNLCSEAGSVREAGKVKQQQLLAKLEEIVGAYYRYSNMVDEALRSVGARVANEPWLASRVS